jgi:hypothetical protein
MTATDPGPIKHSLYAENPTAHLIIAAKLTAADDPSSGIRTTIGSRGILLIDDLSILSSISNVAADITTRPIISAAN